MKNPLLTGDSTDVEMDRLYENAIICCRSGRRRKHGKFSVLVEYHPGNKLLSIAGADSMIGIRVLVCCYDAGEVRIPC